MIKYKIQRYSSVLFLLKIFFLKMTPVSSLLLEIGMGLDDHQPYSLQ